MSDRGLKWPNVPCFRIHIPCPSHRCAPGFSWTLARMLIVALTCLKSPIVNFIKFRILTIFNIQNVYLFNFISLADSQTMIWNSLLSIQHININVGFRLNSFDILSSQSNKPCDLSLIGSTITRWFKYSLISIWLLLKIYYPIQSLCILCSRFCEKPDGPMKRLRMWWWTSSRTNLPRCWWKFWVKVKLVKRNWRPRRWTTYLQFIQIRR